VNRQLNVVYLDVAHSLVTFGNCSSDQQQDVPSATLALAITLSASWSCCPAVALPSTVCLALFKCSCLNPSDGHGGCPAAQSGRSVLPRPGSNVQACSCWYGVHSQRGSKAGSDAHECALDAGSCHVQDAPLSIDTSQQYQPGSSSPCSSSTSSRTACARRQLRLFSSVSIHNSSSSSAAGCSLHQPPTAPQPSLSAACNHLTDCLHPDPAAAVPAHCRPS
jgi:hypothetical protein